MEASQELEANYSLTYPERLRAAWDLTMGSPSAILWLCFFPGLGILLLWLMTWSGSRATGLDYFLAFVCFAFVPALIMWITHRAHVADREKGPYSYRFNDEGIHVTTATSELTHRWPAIVRVRQKRDMLYLYFTARNAHCVPLRVFPAGAAAAIEGLASAGGVPRVGT
ncbi:YcxB family protein [Massilia glaciei]|nr:YcxB family protein [Massilia glaciei]